jgi:hypothetical protein
MVSDAQFRIMPEDQCGEGRRVEVAATAQNAKDTALDSTPSAAHVFRLSVTLVGTHIQKILMKFA